MYSYEDCGNPGEEGLEPERLRDQPKGDVECLGGMARFHGQDEV